jgi:hypothetical protein
MKNSGAGPTPLQLSDGATTASEAADWSGEAEKQKGPPTSSEGLLR